MRVVSRPIPSTLAARPVATRMQSAATSFASPPSGPTMSRMPSSPTTSEAGSKRAFVMTSMPRRLKLLSSSLLTSRSSSGTMAGRYSSRVTLTPKSWNIEANSEPTAPAPTMTMLAGRSDIFSTSSEVSTRTPSGAIPGRLLTRLPVARITSVASSTRSPPVPGVPSSPWSATRTLPAPSRRPRPAIHSTPFLPTRLLRPVHIRRTTWSRRAATTA